MLVVLAAVAAALLAAFYLMPPSSIGLDRKLDVLGLALAVLVAATAGWAVEHAAKQAAQAAQAGAEATVFGRLAASILRGHGDLPSLLEEIRTVFGLTAVSLLERKEHAGDAAPRWYIVASAGEQPPENPEADVVIPAGDSLALAGRGRMLSAADERVLRACAALIAAAFPRHRHEAGDAEDGGAGSRSRATWMAAAIQEAREQITVAEEALAGLAGASAAPAPGERTTLIRKARRAVRRLDRLLTDLGDLSRLHAGALETYLRPVELDDVLAVCLEELGPGRDHLTLATSGDVPDVIADANLLSRILTSLMADALHRSPPGRSPVLTTAALPGQVEIRIADAGPAWQPDGDGAGLPVRLALDLTEAINGTLRCEEAPGGGRIVIITLPTAARRPAGQPGQAGRRCEP